MTGDSINKDNRLPDSSRQYGTSTTTIFEIKSKAIIDLAMIMNSLITELICKIKLQTISEFE